MDIPGELEDVWIASALSEPRNDGGACHREPRQGRSDPDIFKNDQYKKFVACGGNYHSAT